MPCSEPVRDDSSGLFGSTNFPRLVDHVDGDLGFQAGGDLHRHRKSTERANGIGHFDHAAIYGNALRFTQGRSDTVVLDGNPDSVPELPRQPVLATVSSYRVKVHSDAKLNAPTIGAETHLPCGGTKQTGNGHREAAIAAIDFFTEWKTVYIDYSDKLQRAQIDNN